MIGKVKAVSFWKIDLSFTTKLFFIKFGRLSKLYFQQHF